MATFKVTVSELQHYLQRLETEIYDLAQIIQIIETNLEGLYNCWQWPDDDFSPNTLRNMKIGVAELEKLLDKVNKVILTYESAASLNDEFN